MERGLKIDFRKAERGDSEKIIASMRDVDLASLFRHGVEINHLLGEAIDLTQSYIGLINDEIAVLILLHPLSIVTGAVKVGIVVTSVADEHPLVFGRYTKIFFERLAKAYPEMFGEVDPNYKRSVRWLRWLGFEVECDRFYLRAK